jgi:hypothetical protein
MQLLHRAPGTRYIGGIWLAAALAVSCIPKLSQKPSTSQVDFAARGKDNTLLLTPLRLPGSTQVNDSVDKSRGYACAFKTAKNAVNSSFAALNNDALIKLSDPRPYKDKLEVVTPFPVPAASAIEILLTQTAQSRIRQIRAEAAARAGADADKQEGDISAAAGVTGATGTGGIILKEAMDADNLAFRAGNTYQRSILQDSMEIAAHASILSGSINSDRYRTKYDYIPNLDSDAFAANVRNRMPQEIRVSSLRDAATNRQAVNAQIKNQNQAINKLQFMARNHRSYTEFAREFARVSKDLGINIAFDAGLKAASESDKITEMSAAVEALDDSLKLEQKTIIQGLQEAGLMPKSSNFWDQFIFRLDEIAKSPGGKIKIAAAAAAVVGVVIGGGFLIKRALSLPNLDGLVNLSDEEIGRAEQQLLKLGIDYPVTKSYTCKQALGI